MPIVAVTLALVLLTPLLIHATRLWTEGRYVSQEYRWRSAPGGIDAASLILGNPFHVLWGESVRRVYAALHMDPIEASAWIPISALILSAIAVAARRRDPMVQHWAIVGAVFMTWALGPWLIAFGRQTPLMLPAIVVRYVPVVANARIPGRAMVVVHLVLSMLAAMGAAWLSSRHRTARSSARPRPLRCMSRICRRSTPRSGAALPQARCASFRSVSATGSAKQGSSIPAFFCTNSCMNVRSSVDSLRASNLAWLGNMRRCLSWGHSCGCRRVGNCRMSQSS